MVTINPEYALKGKGEENKQFALERMGRLSEGVIRKLFIILLWFGQ